MPLYEYLCMKCGHRFERIQKFSDPPARKCPECGGAVEQVLSAPAVQFKGSGWYVTDYARSGSAGAKADGDSAKPETPAAKTESKADTKPETKPETKKSEKKQ